MSDDTIPIRVEAEDDSAAGLASAIGNVEDFFKQFADIGKQIEDVGKNIQETLGHSVPDAAHEGTKHAGDFMNDLKGVFEEGVGEIMKTFGELFALKELFTMVKEGITHADEIRDLDASVKLFSSSIGEAEKSVTFFEKAMSRARATDDQMLTMYRDLLPKAIKSMTEGTLRDVTVNLVQISTIIGKTPETIEAAFKQILMGRVRGTNPLLFALGMTKDQITADGGMDLLLKKMSELGDKGATLGRSMASAFNEIKETIARSFAEGFNSARDSTESGMTAITEMVKSPDFVEAIKNIGTSVALVIPIIAKGVEYGVALIKGAVGLIYLLIGSALEGITMMWQKTFAAMEWAAEKLGLTKTAQMMHDIAGSVGDLEAGFKATAEKGGEMMENSGHMLMNLWDGDKAAKSLADHVKDGDGHAKNLNLNAKAMAEKIKTANENAKALGLTLKSEVDKLSGEINVASTNNPIFKAWFEFASSVAEAANKVAQVQQKIDKDSEVLGRGNPEIQKAVELLKQYREEAEKLANIKLNTQLSQQFNQIYDRWKSEDATLSTAGMGSIDQQTLDYMRATVGVVLENAKKSAELFRNSMDGIFTDLATTGGKNFGATAAKYFTDLVSHEAVGLGDKMFNSLVGLIADKSGVSFSGQARQGKDGKWYVDGSETPYLTQTEANTNSKIGKGISAGEAIIGAGVTGYQAGASGTPGARTAAEISSMMALAAIGGSTMGTAAIGAAIGTTVTPLIGTLVGAAVGLVVGAVTSYIGAQQRQDEYKFGTVHFSDTGQATFAANKNFTAAAAKQIQEQLQTTFDGIRNGMIAILLKFPDAIIPAMQKIDGVIQSAASAHFMEHFQLWMTDQLPTILINEFKGTMEKLYTGMGLSIDKFNQLWTKFDNVDPSKRMQAWSDLADALINFQKVSDFYAQRGSTRLDFSKGWPVDMAPNFWDAQTSNMGGAGSQSFAQQIADADKQITNLAAALNGMTGVEQISAAKQLSDLMVARMEKEKAYMQQLYQLATSINDSFDSAWKDRMAATHVNKDGTPDLKAQAQFWKQEADTILAMIATTTDPTKLAKMQQDYLADVNKAANLFGQLGPQQAIDANAWALKALETGRVAFINQVNKLGDTLQKANDDLTLKIQPYIDTFTGVVTGVTDGISEIGDDLRNLAPPLGDLKDRIHLVNDELDIFLGKLQNANVNVSVSSSPSGNGYYNTVSTRRYGVA